MTVGAIQPLQSFKADGDALDSQLKTWLHVIEVGGKPITGWSAGWLLEYAPVTPPPSLASMPRTS